MRALSVFVFTLILFTGSPASSQTTIEWWQFWTDPDIKPELASMVQDFERANPDIKVNLTDMTWANGHEKIAIAFASGSAPDVVELGSDWIAQFAAGGFLADLSADIAPDSGQYQGWGMATYQGKVWARPWILGTRVLFANRDLLTRAGYKADYLPVDWGQLLESAVAVRRLGRDIYGWGSNTAEKHRLYKKFLPFFWSDGAQVFTDDGRYCVVSSGPAIDALTYYKTLHDTCGYVADQRGIEDAFLDGKIGYIISGDWLLKRIEIEKRKVDFVTTLIPGPAAGSAAFRGRSFLGGEFLAINAATKQRDAAVKFLAFITSPDNQLRFCKANRSANPSALATQQDPYFSSNLNLQTFVRQARLASYSPVDPDWVSVETEIERAVEEVVFGTMKPATALHNANMRITALKKK
jgi:multiple sugar transport system substrate-binding protein